MGFNCHRLSSIKNRPESYRIKLMMCVLKVLPKHSSSQLLLCYPRCSIVKKIKTPNCDRKHRKLSEFYFEYTDWNKINTFIGLHMF